ncbi:peptidase C45 [bacterium]|nr:peptidase C45 [bacterium]
MGRQLGEAAGEQIRGFCDIALERVNRTLQISRASAMRVAAASIPIVEQYAPEQLEELRGMSESSGVSVEDLMLLQVRNQLQADAAGGCTSLSLAAQGSLGRIVAQNWDNDPALDPFTLVLTRRPTHRPAFTTITQAGLLAYIGFNELGMGLCLNSLPAPSRRLGVPHYCLVRRMYEVGTLTEIVAILDAVDRVIPANIMLSTADGPADLEVTIDNVCVLQDPQSVLHTNHCLHPRLDTINKQFPELIRSRPRLERISKLLEISMAQTGVIELAQIEAALRDHEDHPHSLCRHANADGPHGFWETVFSVIIEPETRQMQITRGTPCNHPYETYRMGN